MTLTQTNINFKITTYRIEDNGLRINTRKLFSSAESFLRFEDIGSKIIRMESRKRRWLFCSALFLVFAISVFVSRLSGNKVGYGAEIFHLAVSLVFWVIYQTTGKNTLILSKNNRANGVEFNGPGWFDKRVLRFVEDLLRAKEASLESKYPKIEGLSLNEVMYCLDAKLTPADGLKLKLLTKNSIEKVEFETADSTHGSLGGICSLTTENEARKIVDSYQDEYKQAGKCIFIREFEDDSYKVALMASIREPYDILERLGTNGANYDVETDEIIAKHKQWNQRFGLKTVAMGYDFCEFAIVNRDIDYKELAGEIYAFCPDVVDQGTETIEALEKEIRNTGRIFLWWD